MIIYLIGFMGVGKSTVGRELSERLEYELIDTDELIEEKEGLSISSIFEKKGEAYFRSLETETVKELSSCDNIVVSCGGGIIKNEENVRLMKESGKVILLTATPEVIYERVKDSTARPLLEGRKSVEGISDLLDERKMLYERAYTDKVSADRPVNEVVESIIQLL